MCVIHEINCKLNKHINSLVHFPSNNTSNHDDTSLSPNGKRSPEEWLLEALPTIPEGSL